MRYPAKRRRVCDSIPSIPDWRAVKLLRSALVITMLVRIPGNVWMKYGVTGDDVDGSMVEATINEDLVGNLMSNDPQLSVGKASCRRTIDVSNGVDHCEIPIDGV